ncbi:hypothetical protein HMI54_001392 [Coelomomyces lativittatus]|nr:hypothetical protein HMI56_000286 [Coelomomyces lativittatus]KAJ1510697.1 hypothetical protein HMI54_001392 [Coelomomyces lativittatus]KAJ1517076.1 hypothetical protein HMI55_000686 [Coelomomyces lativittatus]
MYPAPLSAPPSFLDFYSYACGNWEKYNLPLSYKPYYSVIVEEFEKKKHEMLRILSKKSRLSHATEMDLHLLQFVNSTFHECIKKVDSLDELQIFFNILKVGFQMKVENAPDSRRYYNIFTLLNTFKSGIFLSSLFLEPFNQVGPKRIVLRSPKPISSNLLNTEQSIKYRRLLFAFFQKIELNHPELSACFLLSKDETWQHVAHSFLRFKEELSSISSSIPSNLAFLFNEKYNMSREVLIKVLPEFQWFLDFKYYDKYCPECCQDSFIVESPTYIQNLSSLLNTFQEIEIYRYILSHYLLVSMRENPNYKEFYPLYVKKNDFFASPMERDEECLQRSIHSFPDLFPRLLMKGENKMEYVNNLKEVARNVLKQMHNQVHLEYGASAFDSRKNLHLLKKIVELKIKIQNITSIDTMSGVIGFGLNEDANNEDLFHENGKDSFNLDNAIYSLFPMEPGPKLNYNYLLNKVTIPELYLTLPYSSKRLLLFFVYGSLGTSLGHLYARLMDSVSLSLHQSDPEWTEFLTRFIPAWELKKEEIFEQLTVNHAKLFNDTPFLHLTKDSKAVEHILAEKAALEYAFNAYKDLPSLTQKQIQDYPYLYSPDVHFFLAYAQKQCQMQTPNFQKYYFQAYDQISNRAIVNLALRNFPPFSQTFRCNANNFMNTPPTY